MTDTAQNTQCDAALIAALLAVDPNGLGGVWVKARHGRARDELVAPLKRLPNPPLKVTSATPLSALIGGVDFADSFVQGRIVVQESLLSMPRTIWVSGAERTEGSVIAQIAASLDERQGHVVLLSDEGIEDDPLPSEILRDRLAFLLFERFDIEPDNTESMDPDRMRAAQSACAEIVATKQVISSIAKSADSLGITALRPIQFAVNCARALAALDNRREISDRDIRKAAELVLAHRAAPVSEDDSTDFQPEVEHHSNESEGLINEATDPSDMQVGSAATYLPAGLLASLAVRAKLGQGKGAGATRISHLRGRPLPSRRGPLDGRQRLDVLATLQAAAPWQKLRPSSPSSHIALRPEDFRVRRYKDRSERLLIFMVDASGSAAMARLAEAKGAVELILAEAYEHRDRVCLGLFRDESAEILLPPTQSLTRAKRVLATLPAGGATPLAHGLKLGLDTAQTALRSGQFPTLLFMTDGRGNRALDGRTDRLAAMRDAKAMSRAIRSQNIPTLILDTGRRRTTHVQDLATQLDAEIVALPSLRNSLRQIEPV